MKQKICRYCGAEYHDSNHDKARKYCSLKCAYADRPTGKVERTCETCGIVFIARRAVVKQGFGKYCGQSCMAKAMVTATGRECEYCGDVFPVRQYRLGTARFCSNECRDTARRTRIERPCDICGKLVSAEPGKIAKGWDRFCSKKCQGIASSGENHYNWKGGITPENHAIRSSQPYINWRKDVYVRDDYTCQDCGRRGGYLHAHHIFPFAEYEEHRFAVWNGTTLCKECHMNTHFKTRSAA